MLRKLFFTTKKFRPKRRIFRTNHRLLVTGYCLLTITGCALQTITEPHQIDPANEPTPVPTLVEIAKPTYAVQQGDVIREIRLSGKMVPILDLTLSFGTAGTVSEIFFEQGDVIEIGDVVATLDTSQLQGELILARSALEVAEERLAVIEAQVANDRRRAEIGVEQAEIALEFAQSKVAGGEPTAEQQLDIRLKGLDVELAQIALSEFSDAIDPILQADIDQARLRIDEIEAAINKAQLVAPTGGTITRMPIREGRLIQPEEPAVFISDLSRLDVRAIVYEEDLPLVALDMTGTVQLASRPGDPVEGIITLLPINAGGTGEEDSIVRFQTEDNGQMFNLNDRVTVDMVVAERPEVLWLPPQAIREFSGRTFVVIQDDDGGQRRVDIKTGLENDDQVEVVEGLTLGEVVVGQ